jgi:hypothetical protein
MRKHARGKHFSSFCPSHFQHKRQKFFDTETRIILSRSNLFVGYWWNHQTKSYRSGTATDLVESLNFEGRSGVNYIQLFSSSQLLLLNVVLALRWYFQPTLLLKGKV